MRQSARPEVPPCSNICRAIEYSPDPEGHNGIFLGKNVVTEASKALTKAMWKVGLVRRDFFDAGVVTVAGCRQRFQLCVRKNMP